MRMCLLHLMVAKRWDDCEDCFLQRWAIGFLIFFYSPLHFFPFCPLIFSFCCYLSLHILGGDNMAEQLQGLVSAVARLYVLSFFSLLLVFGL